MIVLTYGQPKSASSYLAELARRACELSGSNQKDLQARLLNGRPGVSGGFWSGGLQGLGKVAAGLAPGERLAIKTHSPPAKVISPLIAEGQLRVLISYRHPGDAALSMFEAGEKIRAEGSDRQPAFARLTTHRAAIDAAIGHVERTLLPWLRSGLGEAFAFDVLVNEPEAILPQIAEVVGIPLEMLNADRAIGNLVSGRKRVYNFNTGLSGRYRDAFSPDDIAYMSGRIAPFIDYCEGRIPREAL